MRRPSPSESIAGNGRILATFTYKLAEEWNLLGKDLSRAKEIEHYDQLRMVGVCWEDACTELEAIMARGSLSAYNPKAAPPNYIGVRVDPQKDVTHVLFKNGSEQRERRPDHYRDSHGERVHWIPQTLIYPHEIWTDKRLQQGECHAYISKPGNHERFVVITFRGGNKLNFATAYDYDLSVPTELKMWNDFLAAKKQVWKR